MVVSPLQTSFVGGEFSPRLRGRVDLDLYRAALELCENFRPTPHGSLLMRSGSEKVASSASAPRLVPFRAASGEEYVIAATDAQVRLYNRATGALVTTTPNFVANGGFDLPVGWGTEGEAGTWINLDGTCKLDQTHVLAFQNVALPAGGYTLRFQYRGTGHMRVTVKKSSDLSMLAEEDFNADPTPLWTTKELAFVADGPVTVAFASGWNAGDSHPGDRFVDDVWIAGGAPVDFVASPWSAAQLEDVHHDSEPAKSRTVFTHQDAGIHVFALSPWGGWSLVTAQFLSAPAAWRAGNWPRRVEVGFQGRMILGSTPEEPNTIWGSKPGAPFNFSLGDGTLATDAYEHTVSLKGGINWIRGQKVLLFGSDSLEHSARGSNRIITASDVDVSDESAFGSAPVQALHLGDQVAFVTRDRKSLRVLNYSQESSGWVSQALTFVAEHLFKGLVKEVHLARSPDPVLVIVKQDGGLVACTYDRAQQVLAWWRVEVNADVSSAAVVDGPDGSELWIAVERGGHLIERIPLYESGRFLDSSVSGVVAGDGTFGGLDHIEGELVRAVVDGAVHGDQVVAGGQVAVDAELAGKPIVVGLPYAARAVTLPLEGGNPRGSSAGAKRRFAKAGVILNESALPLVNGRRVAPDRTPATPMDQAEPLRTGAVKAATLGWRDDGRVTIEQDRPARTEVLALFGVAAVNEI